jgi:ketosteroid isomerase-like protein
MNDEQEIWDALHRHLDSIFAGDSKTYAETTAEDLSLYEWWVTPHRQDGLDFHKFMIDNRWSGAGDKWRYDLLEKRCQRYGDTAIVSYTFMLSIAAESGIQHQAHNESRVLVKLDGAYKVVHVHKSPAHKLPREP